MDAGTGLWTRLLPSSRKMSFMPMPPETQLQFAPYFRADIRVSYKINRPKVSHEVAVDLVNIFGTKNVLKLTYAPNDLDPSANPVRQEYQLGFLPLFYYRIDF